MIEQLDLNHINYSDNEVSLSSFLQEFGSFDADQKAGISTYCEITQNDKVDKKEIGDKMKAKIDEILKFKQIAQDRAYAEIKVKIQQEEEQREREEAAKLEEAQNPPEADKVSQEEAQPEEPAAAEAEKTRTRNETLHVKKSKS